jgi:hypothetical protein
MLLENSAEKLLGYPSGLDETLEEGQAEKIKAVISRLEKVKTKGDIEAIIKMLRAMVI